MEINKENIEATTKVFGIACECALSHLSSREHPRLVELHRINGVECGETLSAVQRIYLASDFFAQIDFSAVMYLLCFALIYGTW